MESVIASEVLRNMKIAGVQVEQRKSVNISEKSLDSHSFKHKAIACNKRFDNGAIKHAREE